MGDYSDPLDQPWEEAIYVTVRVNRCLRERGLVTMRDVIALAEGDELLRHPSFGRLSLHYLREDIAEWKERYGIPPVEYSDKPIDEISEEDELDARIVDQPWDEVLLEVPSRIETCLRGLNITTVREVLDELKKPDFICQHNIGRKSIRDLQSSIDDYFERANGESKDIEKELSIREFVDSAIKLVPTRHRDIFVARYIEGRTLEDIGIELGVTRERVRQITSGSLERVRRHLKSLAIKAMVSTLDRLNSDGILHFTDVSEYLGGGDAHTVQIGLLLAGEDDVQVWRDEFLLRSNETSIDRNIRVIRRAICGIGHYTASINETKLAIQQTVGWHLSDVGLSRFMSVAFGVEVNDDGNVSIEILMRPTSRYLAIVREANRPIHLSEIAARILETTSEEEVNADLDSEPEEWLNGNGADASEESDTSVVERKPEHIRLEHALEAILSRQPDIYRIDQGTFVHRDSLPVRKDILREVVEQCLQRIRGCNTAISTSNLLDELKRNGGIPEGLNAYLLKSALVRHPEVISLRKLLIGHAPSFQEHGISLNDRIEDVLHSADSPLTKEQISAVLRSRGTEFADTSIHMALLDSPFVLNLGDGRFTHVNRIGLAPHERAIIVESALNMLPENGTPITARTIFSEMDDPISFSDLVKSGREDMFLWALLRNDSRFECGPRGLVALKMDNRSSSLLDSIIASALRELVVAPAQKVRIALATGYNFVEVHSVHNALSQGIARGSFRRAFGSLYSLPEFDDRTLIDALVTSYLDEALRIADDPALAGLPTDQLELVARTLYQADRITKARRALEILMHREDLSIEDRRRVRRLWQVVTVREEEDV